MRKTNVGSRNSLPSSPSTVDREVGWIKLHKNLKDRLPMCYRSDEKYIRFFLRGKKESRKSSLKDEVKRIQLTRILWSGTSQGGALLGQMQVHNRIGLIHLAYKRKNSLMEFHVWVHSENMLWSPLTSSYISGATLCDYKSICRLVNQIFSLCQ